MFKAAGLYRTAELVRANIVIVNQQTRNAVVLKRRFPARIAKIGGRPKWLKARNFIYDFVEDTNTLKQEDVKVILTTFVEGYGNRGDILSVRPRRAREELLIPRLGVYASPENISKFEKEKLEHLLPPPKHSSRFAGETMNYLMTHIFLVEMNMDEPWTIERWHIKTAFRRMGCIVPEEAITLPSEPMSGPDPDKEDKEFAVFVSINKVEPFPVRCRVRHWSNDPLKMTSLSPDWHKQPAVPLLNEQIELLSNMPSAEPPDL